MNPHWDFTWWKSGAAAGELNDDIMARKALDNLTRLKGGAPIEFPTFQVFIEPSRRNLILRGLMKTDLWATADWQELASSSTQG